MHSSDIERAHRLGAMVMEERLQRLELDRAFAHAETTHPMADFFASMSGNLVTRVGRLRYRPTIPQSPFGAPKLATETGTYYIVR
jgi:hypothetical protein